MQKRMIHTLAGLLVVASAAVAGPITITFNNSPAQGTAGSVVTLIATMTNTTAGVENLNTDHFGGSPPFVLGNFDDTLFLNNWPLSLAAGASFGPQGLFTVAIPVSAPVGIYTETYNLFGGPGVTDQNLIGTGTFQVQVSTPEPATGISMALGLGALALLGLRARAKA